jgi:uncharacterized protein (DUF1778 family)
MGAIRKTETITFRMESETLDLIRRGAQLQGRSVTSFVSEASRRMAEQEIPDQRVFKVDAETFDEIEKMLDEPPQVNEKLVELFRKTRDWLD